MSTFTPIIDTDPIDFEPEELDIGNTTLFVTRMNSYMSKIQAWTDNIAGSINSINALGLELEESQFSDIAEITNLKMQVLNFQETVATIEAVNGANLPQLQQAVADINTTLSGLGGSLSVDTVSGLSGRLDSIDELMDAPLNELPNNGAFLYHDKASPLWVNNNGTALDKTGLAELLTLTNGAAYSSATEAGRYHYFSSTHGGSEAANNVVAEKFAAAMGITSYNARYIPAFAVLEFTAGALLTGGTYVDEGGVTNAKCFVTTNLSREIAAEAGASTAFWIEGVDAPIYIKGGASDSSRRSWLDGNQLLTTGGETNSPGIHKIDQGVVSHFASRSTVASRQWGSMFEIFVKPSTRIRLACAVINSGIRRIKPHQGPQRSGWSR